jgi:cytochrome c
MVKEEPAAPAKDLGVGPIKSVTLGETVDEALAKTGMEVFEAKCTACHKMGKRFVGPDLTGVTDRREPEWIMNMILNPDVMVVENEAAKALLAEYLSPMANQSLTEDEARSILEYFRTVK